MWLVYVVVALLSLYLLGRRYCGWIVSKLLARRLGCKSVRLGKIGLFCISNVKITVRDGLSVEIQDLRLSSSFVNQEHRKPIMFTAADLRVESEVSLVQNSSASKPEKKSKQTGQGSSEKQARLMQWLQYIGANVHTSNVVLLDAIPDCLFHITFEGLTLDTYLDREGLQIELLCKLIQGKLFLRKTVDALLLDVSVAGSASVDVADGTGKLKRFAVSLHNPRITLFDGIVDYVNAHPIRKSSRASSPLRNPVPVTEPSIVRLLKRTPNISFDIDNLTMQFVAAMNVEYARTLSFSLQKLQTSADTALQTASVKFSECVITDHTATSQFRGALFSATIEPQLIASDSGPAAFPAAVYQVSVHFSNPFIVLYHHDLSWWVNYARGPQFAELFGSRQFADDFSRDFTVEEVHSLQEMDQKLPEMEGIGFSRVLVESELTDFQCQLKHTDGSAVVFGIDLATFAADQAFHEVEFGVESLWCHHAVTGVVNERLSLDFEKHTWGTTVAIGAGLAKYTQKGHSKHLAIQLDECQFEWEEEVVVLIVDFVQSIRRKDEDSDVSEYSPCDSSDMVREDSWSSIESHPRRGDFVVQLSAQKLNLFFTAKQAAFLAFSVDRWRIESSTAMHLFSMVVEHVRIAQGELHPCANALPTNWFTLDEESQKALSLLPCGGCDRLIVRYSTAPTTREFLLRFESPLELIWSPLAYIAFYEVFKKAREISRAFASNGSPKRSRPAGKLVLTIGSDHSVEFGFRLPRDHFMRWIVPSIQFVKSEIPISLQAPTFLLEMDGHLILSLEFPHFQRLGTNGQMEMGRQEFRKLLLKSNKFWWWHADALQIVFPYKYNFAAAFEEVINSVKWIKLVHGMKRKNFTVESPLPSDLRITVKNACLQMNDDPFEVQLQTIYEVMMDEVFERERRRQMLEEKIAALMREDPLFPKSKIDSLYQKLAMKDAQIYVDRIRQVQQPVNRQLLLWTLKDFDLQAFADPLIHGKENVLRFMHEVNPEANVIEHPMEFSTMWARAVELDVGESRMQFKDYPIPYSNIQEAYFWGFVAAAEHLAGDRSIRLAHIDLPAPWGRFTVSRNMCPLKFYHDLECEVGLFSTTYGPCWEPCLSMVSLCWNYINSPSRDPSPVLPFWDKMRLLSHGRFSMLCKKLTTSMLASADPYNETELMDLLWENFGFDWVTGQFRIQSELSAYVRTASKYDDSRLLHLPNFKCSIDLDWDCPGSPHDHHAVTPVAPNKLPDYSNNVEHDSYRSFRSNYLNVTVTFEIKGTPEDFTSSSKPQVLLYANTVKWFDILKNTLTMVNRPVKRGSVFGTPHIKKQQLSKHFRHLTLNAGLPCFMATYWMSSSSQSHGFRTLCNSLRALYACELQVTPHDASDGLIRRPKTAWKTSHFSFHLENGQIRLYGDNRQPEASELADDDNRFFFFGLSRLIYERETSSMQNLTAWQQLLPETHLQGVHKITVHELKASWTVANRNTCLAIMEGLQKAHLLKKVLSNDAMKILQFAQTPEPSATNTARSPAAPLSTPRVSASETDKSPTRQRLGPDSAEKCALHTTMSTTFDDTGTSTLLWKLVGEAGTNLMAYSEESVERPTNALFGINLCKKGDILQQTWQIDLLNSQVVLNGHDQDGFILMTSSRAHLFQNVHTPVWRNAQLLLKKSWTAELAGMQYFAPLVVDKSQINVRDNFRWLMRDVIEEKVTDANMTDQIGNYSTPGEAVGGVVVDLVDGGSSDRKLQLQRVGSRCSCQMFFVTYSDILNAEKFEKLMLPKMNETIESTWGEQLEDVDCFTLKHSILEVCSNSDQFATILDILNNLVLFVDPKKKVAEENRRRLWFKLAKISKEEVRASISQMQSELREVVAIIRSLERQSFFLLRQGGSATEQQLMEESEQLKREIEDCKARQIALIDELATTISCFKEREMEERSEVHRRQALQMDDEQSLIARRFEVCFEDCIWRLTEADGQLSITEMQIRNFLYTRTARIDNSGEHLLEVATVKVLNLIPNSKYRDVLARLPNPEVGTSDKTPAVRVICRDIAPVGGISVKEHFEVNIVPMHAQITHRFFRKMMDFFFPGRNIEASDQQNLDSDEQQQTAVVTQTFSLTRRLRGAVGSSFRTKAVANTEPHSDEIDKMKERAEKNNVFVYIIIPQVMFVVSYKGNKEKNIEDVDRFTFSFPICEYHDKNWTWLDLALAVKQRCRRMLLQQFMTQKFLRTRVMGPERAIAGVEPIDEEEKKRIVLGTTTPIAKKKKSKA